MITIKTGSYTATEINVLKHLAEQIFDQSVITDYCSKNECCTCTIKHLCGDLLRAREHIRQLNLDGTKHKKK